jgi:hypothetical protein
VNLGAYWQVRTNRQSHPLAPSRILEPPQLDDGARRRVTGCGKVGQAHMVGASVYAIDYSVSCSAEFVVETARDQPADDRLCRAPVLKREFSHAAFDTLVGEPAVDTPDDVVALAQRPHHGLGILRQVPSRWTEWLGETKALQSLHAADHGGASVSIHLDVGAGPKVYDAIMLLSFAGERAIEPGPTIGLDLSVQIATDLEFASRPEFEGRQMGGARARRP